MVNTRCDQSTLRIILIKIKKLIRRLKKNIKTPIAKPIIGCKSCKRACTDINTTERILYAPVEPERCVPHCSRGLYTNLFFFFEIKTTKDWVQNNLEKKTQQVATVNTLPRTFFCFRFMFRPCKAGITPFSQIQKYIFLG